MRCIRCSGLVIMRWEELLECAQAACCNCGWRDNTAVCHPIEPDPNRRWTSELCQVCMERASIRKKPYCRTCREAA